MIDHLTGSGRRCPTSAGERPVGPPEPETEVIPFLAHSPLSTLDGILYIRIVTAMPFFVYILLCSDGSYYVGHTDDLVARVRVHESGDGCQHTRARLPVILVFSQAFQDRQYAKAAERQLKGWSRAKKQALISGQVQLLPDLARCRTNPRSPELVGG